MIKRFVNSLEAAKIICAALLVSSLLYLYIVSQLQQLSMLPLISFGTRTLNLIVIVLTVWSVYGLINGYFLPRLLIKGYRRRAVTSRKNPLTPLSIYVLRGAHFEAVAILGLILGVFGLGWGYVLPFITASTLAQLLTFPTQASWNKTVLMFSELNSSDSERNSG